MAATFEQMQQFIELRAENVSYAKIAKQIGVSRTTLIDWAKNCELEIENRRAVTQEALNEEYKVWAATPLTNVVRATRSGTDRAENTGLSRCANCEADTEYDRTKQTVRDNPQYARHYNLDEIEAGKPYKPTKLSW